MEQSQKTQKRIIYGILFSFFLHLLFIQIQITKDSHIHEDKKDLIELTVADLETLKNIHRVQVPSESKKQIVNNELSGREEAPVDSRFLGEKNQTYDRQTTSSKIDIFNKAALGTRAGQIAGEAVQTETKTATKTQNASKSKTLSLKDLGLGTSNTHEQANKMDQIKNEKLAKLGIKNGDAASRGLSSNNDHIENVALGDFTHLNTTEFKYYGFYHRIRQKLEQFWGNNLREKAKKIYAAGRRLPASEDLVTSVAVDLNDKGEIVRVKMLGTSGVQELDEAAVESFNKAGPFPNPPSGMLKNGVATVEWGFVVKG